MQSHQKLSKICYSIVSSTHKFIQYISCRNPFPSELQYANVTPIINLLVFYPQFLKYLEAVSTNFIVLSSSLSPYLCGFRKGYNAQHALLRLKNKLNMSLDKKENIGNVYDGPIQSI